MRLLGKFVMLACYWLNSIPLLYVFLVLFLELCLWLLCLCRLFFLSCVMIAFSFGEKNDHNEHKTNKLFFLNYFFWYFNIFFRIAIFEGCFFVIFENCQKMSKIIWIVKFLHNTEKMNHVLILHTYITAFFSAVQKLLFLHHQQQFIVQEWQFFYCNKKCFKII